MKGEINMSKFWDKEVIITEVPDEKSVIRVSRVEKDGKEFIDVRKYVAPKGSEDFTQHTTKGMSIPSGKLNEVIAALQMVQRGAGVVQEEPAPTRKPRHRRKAS